MIRIPIDQNRALRGSCDLRLKWPHLAAKWTITFAGHFPVVPSLPGKWTITRPTPLGKKDSLPSFSPLCQTFPEQRLLSHNASQTVLFDCLVSD